MSISRNIAAVDIDTNVKTCFLIPPSNMVSCKLNNHLIKGSISVIALNNTLLLKVNNWTTTSLDNTQGNYLKCETGELAGQEMYHANFFSLSKL